jgi:hypothetical protein
LKINYYFKTELKNNIDHIISLYRLSFECSLSKIFGEKEKENKKYQNNPKTWRQNKKIKNNPQN